MAGCCSGLFKKLPVKKRKRQHASRDLELVEEKRRRTEAQDSELLYAEQRHEHELNQISTVLEPRTLLTSSHWYFANVISHVEVKAPPLQLLDGVVITARSYSCHILPTPRIVLIRPFESQLKLVAYNPCFDLVAVGCLDSTCQIWNLERGKPLPSPISLNHNAPPNANGEFGKDIVALEWNPDGSLLATGCIDGSVRVWTSEGMLKQTYTQESVTCIRWSAHGVYLAASGTEGDLHVWRMEGEQAERCFIPHTDRIGDMDWLGDETLAMCSKDGKFSIYTIRKEQILEAITQFNGNHSGEICCIKLDSGAKFIATSCRGNQIKIWCFDGTLHAPLQGHGSQVWALQWAPGNRVQKLLASGSQDRSVRLWEVNEDGACCLRELKGHGDAVYDVQFSPNGQLLASSCWDGYLRIWSTHCGRMQHSHRSQGMQYKLNWNGTGDKIAVAYNIGEIGSAVVLNYQNYHTGPNRLKLPTKPCPDEPSDYEVDPYSEPVYIVSHFRK